MNHLWRAWSTRSAADDLWATEISLRGKGESRPLKDWRLMTAATFEQRLFPLACARPPRRVGDEAIVSPNVREIPLESRGHSCDQSRSISATGEISRTKGRERGRRW